jgi:HEAT repeat protein
MLCLACALLAAAQGGAVSELDAARAAELVKRLSDRQGAVRVTARDELIKLGPAAVPALLGEMRDWKKRERLLQMFQAMGAPAVPALLARLSDPELGGNAGSALVRASGPGAAGSIPQLLACLRAEATRVSCGQALVRAAKGAAPHREAISAARKDPAPEVRAYACAALAEVGASAVLDLKSCLADKAAPVRAAAAAGLGRLGRAAAPAREALKAATKDSDPDVRHEAAAALKNLNV